jgi:GTPase KRas protein
MKKRRSTTPATNSNRPQIAINKSQIISQAPMVLVANKSDLENERQVTTGEGQDLAKSFSIPFMETSAKTRVNVEESFFVMCSDCNQFK